MAMRWHRCVAADRKQGARDGVHLCQAVGWLANKLGDAFCLFSALQRCRVLGRVQK